MNVYLVVTDGTSGYFIHSCYADAEKARNLMYTLVNDQWEGDSAPPAELSDMNDEAMPTYYRYQLAQRLYTQATGGGEIQTQRQEVIA